MTLHCSQKLFLRNNIFRLLREETQTEECRWQQICPDQIFIYEGFLWPALERSAVSFAVEVARKLQLSPTCLTSEAYEWDNSSPMEQSIKGPSDEGPSYIWRARRD